VEYYLSARVHQGYVSLYRFLTTVKEIMLSLKWMFRQNYMGFFETHALVTTAIIAANILAHYMPSSVLNCFECCKSLTYNIAMW
jgi:hypothetical protein